MVHLGRCIYNTHLSRQTMSPALYSISIKSKKKKKQRIKESKKRKMCLCTYLPILRRDILFLSVFQCLFRYTQKREIEKKRILNVKTMHSFNSEFLLLLFFFSLSCIVFSHHTRRKKKEKEHNSPHRKKKKKIDNNSNEQQQRQEPDGGFFWSFRQNILIIQSKWSIRKNLYKKKHFLP